MVRIVAGEREDPNIALLQGMQLGQGYRQARQAKIDAQNEQMNQALRAQEIQLRFENARAEREELLNRAAQMGDVHAIQQMAFESQIPESDKIGRAALGMLQGITDPKARAEALPVLEARVKEARQQEKTNVTLGEIERGVKNKFITPAQGESFKASVAAGGDLDAIVKEIRDVETDIATRQAAMQDNAEQIAQMDQFIAAMPPGTEKRKATIEANKYKNDVSAQEKAGSGLDALAKVQIAGNEARDRQIATYIKTRTAKDYGDQLAAVLGATEGQFGEKEFPSNFLSIGDKVLGGGPVDQPRTPAMQQHIEKQRAEKERRFANEPRQYGPFVPPEMAADVQRSKMRAAGKGGEKRIPLPRGEIKKAKTEDDVIDALIADGKELTPENISAALSHWRAGGR